MRNGFSSLPRIRFDMHLCVESLFCGSGKGFLRCMLDPVAGGGEFICQVQRFWKRKSRL
ncbi:MAG: hypothetical protein ACFWUC_07935 [Oscillospiraceae bacterium]|jgi:hypothetical protein